MKFDFCIGNPPYQEDTANSGDRPNPVYDKFMDASYQVADCVELVHPARFLFNAGQTPKAWNQKMLNDEHFKILFYDMNSANVFPTTSIMGGIAISLHDNKKNFGAIKTFSSHSELNSICSKVHSKCDSYFDQIVSSQGIYRFSEKAFTDFPQISSKTGKGTGNKIVSSVVDKLPELFKRTNFSNAIKMIGRSPSGRFERFIDITYIQATPCTNAYKVLVPEANGSGAIGEVEKTQLIGEPFIGGPNVGFTDTFLGIGCYDTEEEAKNVLNYIKGKFARAMLGVNKVTQHNPKSTWKDVPIQDFTSVSDIDWSVPIKAIDQQLYRKYDLSDEEINFIETHVKEMA